VEEVRAVRFVPPDMSGSVIDWKREEFNSEVRFTPPSCPAFSKVVDGGEYLDALLAVKNAADALRFLNRFGDPGCHFYIENPPTIHTDTLLGRSVKSAEWPQIIARDYIYLGEIRELQTALRLATELPVNEWSLRTSRPVDWFDPERPPLELHFDAGRLTGLCRVTRGAMACSAQLFFEKASGAEYGWCARTDCDGFFRIASRHPRKYCSPECAHLAAVRASRERLRRSVAVRKRRRGAKKPGGGTRKPE